MFYLVSPLEGVKGLSEAKSFIETMSMPFVRYEQMELNEVTCPKYYGDENK